MIYLVVGHFVQDGLKQVTKLNCTDRNWFIENVLHLGCECWQPGVCQLLVLPIAISNYEKEAKHICWEFDSFQIGLLVF